MSGRRICARMCLEGSLCFSVGSRVSPRVKERERRRGLHTFFKTLRKKSRSHHHGPVMNPVSNQGIGVCACNRSHRPRDPPRTLTPTSGEAHADIFLLLTARLTPDNFGPGAGRPIVAARVAG